MIMRTIGRAGPAAVNALIALIALIAAIAAAQDTSKMAQQSIVVFGTAGQGNDIKIMDRGGAFFVDRTHVVTSLYACCGKTKSGSNLVPVAFVNQAPVGAKVVWSLQEADLAVLELTKPYDGPVATLAPLSAIAGKGQPVITIQHQEDSKQPPKVTQGTIKDQLKIKDTNIPLLASDATMLENNDGSALFDACGNVIAVNWNFKDGVLASVVMDPVIEGLKATGVQATVSTQPCGAASAGGGGGAPGGGGAGGGGKQKGKAKPEDEDEDAGNRWRMPKGNEWIPVILIAVVVIVALRPAGKRAARALTSRRRAPIPEPAAYPYPVPGPRGGPMGPMIPPPPPFDPMAQLGLMAPPPLGTKPVLRGVAGQYAGSAVGLESNPSTLGRDPHSANLVFGPEAASVSKRHCTVRWEPHRGVFVLEDHGSTNGTFLASGERLAPNQPRDLRPGERFYIGDLRNQFEVGLDS